MERRLIEAADKGDVDKLHNLVKDYPFLLKAVALANGDTSLYIACMGAHVNFVKEVLNLRPEFIEELNQDGLSPLHVASANGDIDVRKELLKVGSHLCLVQGYENRIPFHYAVVKGRIKVNKELLSACQDSITVVTARGETCFHLAVKHNQFKTLKVLCDHVITSDREDILNLKDEQGNTILHLAASRKQYQNFGYRGQLEVNSLNQNGLTALDVLVSEGGDSEIEKILSLAGAITAPTAPQNSIATSQSPSQNQSGQERRRDRPIAACSLRDCLRHDRIKYSPSKVRNMLLVMAALIATATYSAVLSPPGGVWQDDSLAQPPHIAGTSVLATHSPVFYGLFLLFNSFGFFISLQMMYLLTGGLPLRFELILALTALIATYDNCVMAMTPIGKISIFITVLAFAVPQMMALFIILGRDYMKRQWSRLPRTRVISA